MGVFLGKDRGRIEWFWLGKVRFWVVGGGRVREIGLFCLGFLSFF